MTSLQGKRAVVTGASSGVGKAVVHALLRAGVQVTAVARGAERLQTLAMEGAEGLSIVAGDASDQQFIERLLLDTNPDLVVLAAGIIPPMGQFDEMEWESFSETWNADLKASFHVLKQAHTQPLSPGSRIVVLSSGAARNGSPLSGGYAGAKRMQWMLADYAQKLSTARQLDIRTVAVLPVQLIEGTSIGANAAAAYGAMNGITAEAFLKRFPVPLDAEKVATAIMTVLRGDLAASVNAIAVSGTGIEPLA